MHTILGANGVIGYELSRALSGMGERLRQVSRTPRKVNETDEVFPADLLDPKATELAISGIEVTYLVAGLKYDARVWQEQWPRIMRNVIDGCKRHGSALVFFDNVYAYGRVDGVMTEETPFNPCSRKGEVRAKIATTLLNEMHAGTVRGMIVRAADFYGPGALRAFRTSPCTPSRTRPMRVGRQRDPGDDVPVRVRLSLRQQQDRGAIRERADLVSGREDRKSVV